MKRSIGTDRKKARGEREGGGEGGEEGETSVKIIIVPRERAARDTARDVNKAGETARREMASSRWVSNDAISRPPPHTRRCTAALASVVGCGAASRCFIWSGAA